MTDTEISYNSVMEKIVELMLSDYFSDEKEKELAIKSLDGISREVTANWCRENAVSTLTGAHITFEYAMGMLQMNIPMVITTDQGTLIVSHGSKNGTICAGPGCFVRTDDNRFTDIVRPGEYLFMGCYPAARPEQWSHNGRHYHNIGAGINKPMTLWIDDNGTIYIAPVSDRHQELIEGPLTEATQAAAQA